jgi:hypothetical protein
MRIRTLMRTNPDPNFNTDLDPDLTLASADIFELKVLSPLTWPYLLKPEPKTLYYNFFDEARGTFC